MVIIIGLVKKSTIKFKFKNYKKINICLSLIFEKLGTYILAQFK